MWLSNPQMPYRWGFVLRVIIKTGLLFAACNLIFALTQPLPTLGELSIYNRFVPGRERLPYGESPAAYNLSLNNLNAMFASHQIATAKADDEFRVLLIGDSSTWGFLLEPEDTVAGQLNAANIVTADGRTVRVYNLGYPTMSLTKDLMLLDYGMRYEPDMVIWLVTLESFPRAGQLVPLVENNVDASEPELLDRSIVAQRRPLADLLRLQLYGVMWATTGIDQLYPAYDLRQSDFDEDTDWKTFSADAPFTENDLAYDVLQAGADRVGGIPFLLVNEPMFISEGENSDLRYNFFYPRWAYDLYRDQLAALAAENDWHYLDVWNAIAPDTFTDSPVHMTPGGSAQLSAMLIEASEW
jgi:hypothetical protein